LRNVLEVKNLGKIYGFRGNSVTALNRVSFDVKEGEFLGIMGPSGSGKSTLLNVISTIDKPTSGNVSIKGDDIGTYKGGKLAEFRAKNLGFLFQDYNLLDILTIRENVALSLTINKTKQSTIDGVIEEQSKKLGIYDILDKFPYEVSGGQMQRASALRAIINNPSLILADEPTGALDSKSSNDLLKTLKYMNEDMKSTILMVTHDPMAASYCDRILFLKDGGLFAELVNTGDRQDFYKRIIDVELVMGGSTENVC